MTIIRITLYFLCCLCLSISMALAQPDYRIQNLPRVGSSYTLRYCDTTDVIVQPGGSSQIWDYTTLRPQNRLTTISYLLPVQTPFAADFPAANLVQRTDTTFIYWRSGPTGLTKFGTVYQDKSKELLLADPYDLGPIPIKYNMKVNDNLKGNFVRVTPPSTVARGGNSEFFYDGFGTLNLPSGIINNVMRIVTTDVIADTSKSGALKTIGTTKITTYQWIGADSTSPSLVITEVENSFSINDQVVSTKRSRVVQYDQRRPKVSTNVVYPDDTPFHLTLSPNPATELSLLRFRLEQPGMVHIELFDILGNRLWQIEEERDGGEHSLPLHLRNLSSGVYYLRLRVVGNAKEQVIPLQLLR